MCGSPAVPKTSARPNEIWSSGFLKSSPGVRKFRVTVVPLASVELIAVSDSKKRAMLKSNFAITKTLRKTLPLISSTAIGEIVSVKASLNYKSGSADMNLPYAGGGALFELGIYPVFLCTLLLGKPEYVQATGRITENGEDEFFSAFLSYENGQYGFIETNKMVRGNSAAMIIGERGSIQIKNPWSAKPEGIEVDFYDGTKVLHKSEWDGIGLYFELDEVYESLQQEAIESQLYSQYFSLDVMQTLDDIRKQLS